MSLFNNKLFNLHLLSKLEKLRGSKVGNNLSSKFNNKQFIASVLSVVATIVVACLPTDSFGIEGLTVVQQRIIAIFVFATLMWLTEAIPAWATSVCLICMLLFATSDSALSIYSSGLEKSELLSYKVLMATFADPIIILFLGGFVLAMATTKSGLDVVMARYLLKPFGKRSEVVLLGFILITGLFSMFISNTATAAMMLTFLAPVFKALPADGKGRVALTLAIPLGANIGGIGTPIGTPNLCKATITIRFSVMLNEVLKSFSAFLYDCFAYFLITFNAFMAISRTLCILFSSRIFRKRAPKYVPINPPINAVNSAIIKFAIFILILKIVLHLVHNIHYHKE